MKGKLFLFLFALPFFGVGVWMGYSIGSNLIDAWQMQQWTPVDAVLHRAGYETHSGDDSDTYKAYAEYSYAYGGQTYLNDRVAISGGGDNIGDYQQDLGRRLGGVMGRGESVTVYVNPADPSDSIIDPTIRWGLLGFKAIFFLVFGGVGLGLMIATFRAPKEKDDSAPKFVDKPWLANDKWQGGPLRSGSKSSMWFAWGFAALWNLISAPLPFVVYEEVVEKDNMLASIGLLFPAIGMGLLWWAVSRTLEWRRFGAAPLTLDPFPGSIGGHVGGMIDVNVPFDSSIHFSLTLTNLHSYVTGSGDSRSRKESPKWQDSQVAHSTSGPGGTRLSFRFDVPDNLAESDADQHEESYDLWRLNLKAELPGADIDRDYEIPVYATAEQSSRLSNFSINEAQSEQRKIDLDVIRNMVDLEHGVSGKSMVYPMFRNLGSGISGLFFGGVFSAIGWFLFDQEGIDSQHDRSHPGGCHDAGRFAAGFVSLEKSENPLQIISRRIGKPCVTPRGDEIGQGCLQLVRISVGLSSSQVGRLDDCALILLQCFLHRVQAVNGDRVELELFNSLQLFFFLFQAFLGFCYVFFDTWSVFCIVSHPFPSLNPTYLSVFLLPCIFRLSGAAF